MQSVMITVYNLEDESHPGRSVELDEDVLQTLVEQNPIVIVEELVEKFEFDDSFVHRHLRHLIQAIEKNRIIYGMTQ